MTSNADWALANIRDELHDAAEELSRAASLMSELGMPEQEEAALLSNYPFEMMGRVGKMVRSACPLPKVYEREGPREMNEATRKFVVSDLSDELDDAAEEFFTAANMMSKLGMSAVREIAEKGARVAELKVRVHKTAAKPTERNEERS